LAAGIQQPTELESSVDSIVEGLDEFDDKPAPAAVVAAAAQYLAQQAGASLHDAGLRLFAHRVSPATERLVEASLSAAPLSSSEAPYLLGRLYERLLSPGDRRRTAAHLTSASVAQGLVSCTQFAPATRSPSRVLDPAVGGAAFLLAAASHQLAAGHDVEEIFDSLYGIDIDGGAVSVAEAALGLWLIEHGHAPRPSPHLHQGDGLVDELPIVDVVVGNPPFRNQLQRDSARSSARRSLLKERWGQLAGAYTDDAWLFVAAGLTALRDGTLVMIQPLSILSARHAEPVRRLVDTEHSLAGLWVPFAKVFDAAVDVCGVVIDAAAPSAPGKPASVKRWFGVDFEPRPELDTTRGEPAAWGPLASQMQGVPVASFAHTSDRTLRDLAATTAGFRRQFYGLKPHVTERTPSQRDPISRLVTVGMIDPLTLQWGRREFTFAGDRYSQPVLDLDALAEQDPALMDWITERLRPKLLVATQTRVVETWADTEGAAVPATPVISVEPHDPSDLWHVAAALNAPLVNAWLAGHSFGTALSISAIKFSAQDLASLPAPTNRRAWDRAASLLQNSCAEASSPAGGFAVEGVLPQFADLMEQAYATTSDVSVWWHERLSAVLGRYS